MPLTPTDAWLAEVKSRVVELPLARKQRFMRDYQLPAGDAETFVNDVQLGNYFEPIAKKSKNPKAVANWVINNLRAKLTKAESTKSGRSAQLLNATNGEPNRSTNLDKVKLTTHNFADLKFKPEALLNWSILSKPKPSAVPPRSRFLPKCSRPANLRRQLFRKKASRKSATPARLKNSATTPSPPIPNPVRRLQIRQGRRAEFAQRTGDETFQRKGQPRARRRNFGTEVEGLKHPEKLR